VSGVLVSEPTYTVKDNGKIVPWLAAKGRLAYTPRRPPKDDELFDYGRVMPQVFEETDEYRFGLNTRFGDTQAVDEFWSLASRRRHQITKVFYAEGSRTEESFKAPMAVYRAILGGVDSYVLLQGGRIQVIPCGRQPKMEDGRMLVYRGCGSASVYGNVVLKESWRQILQQASALDLYFDFVAFVFMSSALGFYEFNVACACRSDHLGASWIKAKHKSFWEKSESTPETNHLARRLYDGFIYQHFSTNELMAQRKFGPNYVEVETDLTNVAISSFFVGEDEVKVIDPRKTKIVSAHGCTVTDIDVLEHLRFWQSQHQKDAQQDDAARPAALPSPEPHGLITTLSSAGATTMSVAHAPWIDAPLGLGQGGSLFAASAGSYIVPSFELIPSEMVFPTLISSIPAL
jgi:hypothetical protein